MDSADEKYLRQLYYNQNIVPPSVVQANYGSTLYYMVEI